MAGYPGKQGRKPKPATIAERNRQAGITPISMHTPDHLDDTAKAEWKRTIKLMKDAGLIDRLDRSLLEAYCSSYSRWVEAEEYIKKHGLIIKAPNGFPMQNPYLAISNKAKEHMLKILTELGMTPASRARLPVKQSTPEAIRPLPKITIEDPRYLLEGK